MHKTLSVLLISTMVLSACSSWRNSRANPSNWFGSSTPSPTETSPNDANALLPDKAEEKGLFAKPDAEDNSVSIAVINELRIDPTPAGAIIYSAGTATRQGAYNARLSRVNSEELAKDGIMEFTFRVDYPEYATAQGTERSRMVSDAINVTTQELEGIRLVRVKGQQNALESRRR
ncbi:hypothetical protein SAMN05444358_101644 [Ruegeria halocynthiae]|uniref:Lipoprotein n=2 Tax=Ruegeria halocynthiae TaxID=985054 RepID=A0A1H2SZD0_9RHOB|nr:hypothetical protein SAMN05444358_101644 [Ruegeria halocynthiae]